MYLMRFFCLAIILVAATGSSAIAESRGVAIVLTRDKDKITKVSIHSDVKEEKKTDIPLDEAVKIVVKMEGWGSSVMVCMVANQTVGLGQSDGVPPLGEVLKLLKAIEENRWLKLDYLRIGDAKGGDAKLDHFIEATKGR
jgi:hypothetical protein